ncbi:O-antigen ligase family protein [Pseudomonas asplenii]|uniref:O-antigen ligase family protein n=1 Tax=Pseudomonas asplenii TaxID=53407 RepID=UPI0037C55474
MSVSNIFSSKLYLGICFFLYSIPIFFSPFFMYEHDWQRVFQASIGSVAVFFYAFSTAGEEFLGKQKILLLFLFFWGVVSSIFSNQPSWGMVEVSVFWVCVCVSLVFFKARACVGMKLDYGFLVVLIFLIAAKVTQFFSATLSAFMSDGLVFDTDLLLAGFSNKRFYGQFQTFTLPLLVFPLIALNIKRPTKCWVVTLLSLWWMIAISGGTRGTWLGLGVAACVVFMTGSSGKRWVAWQLFAVAVGLTFYWLLFSVLTGYLGIDVANFAGDRLTTSLSNRGPLWQQAWDMIRERPWLGFGPMHFADIHNPIAAHPHQAILQWACEWGIPSTLLVMWLVGRGLWATFRLVRERADSNDPVDLLRVCLFASLIGALTQSMVDGVIVMPYSQLWLSLVVGWLMGIHVWKSEPAKPSVFIHWSWMGISSAAVLFLVYVVIRDVPHLDERNKLYQQQYGGHLQPRFWAQGVIAIKPE